MGDLELAGRCINGDKSAWDEFVEKYSRLIYRYIHNILRLNSLPSDSAQDLSQEIFILLRSDNFKKFRSYKAKNGASLASWLRQVVVNHTIDHCRRIKPILSLDNAGEDQTPLKESLPSKDNSSSELLGNKEDLSVLTDCIKDLSVDDRFFVEMHFVRDLSLEEMGRVLLISRPAVDMRKTRVIQRLRDCFESKGFLR